MADARRRSLSPRQRAPFSPTKNPCFIRSNDDNLERSEARAARAAATRRKSLAPNTSVMANDDLILGKDQVLELFHNCIKLASENKINQKNTWELNLIDHLGEIIKVEEENDDETNFQKASCTLEAGVKIYSMRVDSVHSEAYKVLGGINRVGQEPEEDHVIEDGIKRTEHGESDEMKDHGKKLSPLSTLEPSFAALNVKKFDVAFVVDPLYHQTSAQFDEGGAKGLLLNNLGVYDNCRVLFDSMEVPGKYSSPVPQCEEPETVDLSFASGCIQEMVTKMLNTTDITPSLRAIKEQYDDDHQIPSESYASAESSVWQGNDQPDIEVDFTGETAGNPGCWELGHDDQASVVDDGACNPSGIFPSEEDAPDLPSKHFCNGPAEEDGLEEVDKYLLLSLGFSTKQNAWAGPTHWKYRKNSDSAAQIKENVPPREKKRRTKKMENDINFSSSINNDYSHLFLPPKNPKSLLLPSNRTSGSKKLPEDCHYQPEDLMKLFLLPNVLCFGNKGRKRTDVQNHHLNDGFEENAPLYDEDNSAIDDEHSYYNDIQDTSMLVKQPRQVSKIEVQYDKTSKIVDVQSLKETIWEHISHVSAEETYLNETPQNGISFKQVLATFPDSCQAAASLEDISPHLCFICLLHLANEHGLHICGCPSMDELTIHLKPQN